MGEQASIERASPPFTGQPPNLFSHFTMHQDELGQALIRLDNLEDGNNERLVPDEMAKMKHQNA